MLLNTQLIAELIDQGNFGGVKEAMERSIAEGSQTFEQDLARLISEGLVTREEGLSHSDSPTNLLWRLQNEQHGGKRQPEPEPEAEPGPSFTEITLGKMGTQSERATNSSVAIIASISSMVSTSTPWL